MTPNEIESKLMQADTGDALGLHEMLIELAAIVRIQEYQINGLVARVDRLLEAVPSTGEKK